MIGEEALLIARRILLLEDDKEFWTFNQAVHPP